MHDYCHLLAHYIQLRDATETLHHIIDFTLLEDSLYSIINSAICMNYS